MISGYEVDNHLCPIEFSWSEKKTGTVVVLCDASGRLSQLGPKDNSCKIDNLAVDTFMSVLSCIGHAYTNIPGDERFKAIKENLPKWIIVEEN